MRFLFKTSYCLKAGEAPSRYSVPLAEFGASGRPARGKTIDLDTVTLLPNKPSCAQSVCHRLRRVPHNVISLKKTLQKCSEFRTKYGTNLACIFTYFPYAFSTRAKSLFLSQRYTSYRHGMRTAGRTQKSWPKNVDLCTGIRGTPKRGFPISGSKINVHRSL